MAQGETAAEQVHGCFELIGQSIKDAGGRGLEDVVITRMIAANVVGDLDELAKAHHQGHAHRALRSRRHGERITFGGTLVRDWIKVEIEATAIVGS